MTPTERKAAWATVYILALIGVVVIAPSFLVGPLWNVWLLGAAGASALVGAIFYAALAILDDDFPPDPPPPPQPTPGGWRLSDWRKRGTDPDDTTQ